MGEWYNIGLQTGKKVTEAIDQFIKTEHKNDNRGANFDPDNRKTLADGSTIYEWNMKWNPCCYEDEKRFVSVFSEFHDAYVALLDEDEKSDYAYKLVAVGDEGGQDEMGNEIGYEIFYDLYSNRTVAFPESFDNEPDDDLKAISEVYSNGDREISSTYMAELLLDPCWTSWKMFEGLAEDYINGNADVRAGIDKAVSALTGWKLSSIAKELLERNRENDENKESVA